MVCARPAIFQSPCGRSQVACHGASTIQTNRSVYEHCPGCEVCVYQFSGLVQKIQAFRYLKDTLLDLKPESERAEAGMRYWRASTSSRSAESVDRECEEVGIAWARVERSGSVANVNSHRVSSRGSTISTNECISTHDNRLEMAEST